jgi:hypothetical protein
MDADKGDMAVMYAWLLPADDGLIGSSRWLGRWWQRF